MHEPPQPPDEQQPFQLLGEDLYQNGYELMPSIRPGGVMYPVPHGDTQEPEEWPALRPQSKETEH